MEKKMDDLSQGIADISTLAGSSNTAPVIAQVQASASPSGGSDSLSSGDVSATSAKTFAQVVAAALVQKQLFLNWMRTKHGSNRCV